MNIRDALNAVSPDTAGRSAFLAVDAMQSLPPADQLAGAAMLFALMSQKYKMNPSQVNDVLVQTSRRITDALRPQVNERPGDIARAIRMYVETEL